MEPSIWPFIPDHITCDGEKSATNPDLRYLTGQGIIANEYLHGMLTSISASLEHPMTLTEFSRDGTRTASTDCGLIHFQIHPHCEKFREFAGVKYCRECDNIHALIFKGATSDNMERQVNDTIAASDYIREYRPIEELGIELKNMHERYYLSYDCPLLGYRELLFPVMVEGRVLAVIFLGQICLEDREEFISEVQDAFIRKHPECFDDYRGDHPKISLNKIKEELRELAENQENLYNFQKESGLIIRAIRQIRNLEENLSEQLNLQRERHILKNLVEITRNFRTNLPREFDPREHGVATIWQNLGNRLTEMVEAFNLEYMIAFSMREDYSRIAPEILEPVCGAGTIPEHLNRISYDFKKVTPDMLFEPTNSLVNESLIDGFVNLPSGFDKSRALARSYPLPFLKRQSLIILEYYKDSLQQIKSLNQPGGILDIALQSFWSAVISALSDLNEVKNEARTADSLNVFGHEIGQVTAGMEWLNESYLLNAGRLKSLGKSKVQDPSDDLSGYLRQLRFLSKHISMMLSEFKITRKAHFYPYSELIFKWVSTYRADSKNKSIMFQVHPERLEPDDPLRPMMYGDMVGIEQLLYNLVSNAVKYCYPGTRIHLDCKTTGKPGSPHYLTVVDYGHEMISGDKVYDLYFRGENVRHVEEGLGIGMYNARKIAEAHGGSIYHSSEKVSDYNVPMIDGYLAIKIPQVVDRELSSRLKQELRRLKEGEYEEIVARDEDGAPKYRPYRSEILKFIKKPTYKVSVTVEIPAKEGEK